MKFWIENWTDDWTWLGSGCHPPAKMGFGKGLSLFPGVLAGMTLSAILALTPNWANAQQPVVTYPKGLVSTNSSGTITAGSTFQKVFGANTNRAGCTIQNKSTNTMYVTEGLGVANSTTGNAMTISPGALYNCQLGGIVLVGEIDLMSVSAGDAFYAAQE